jgi:hypothetical protein
VHDFNTPCRDVLAGHLYITIALVSELLATSLSRTINLSPGTSKRSVCARVETGAKAVEHRRLYDAHFHLGGALSEGRRMGALVDCVKRSQI